MIWVKSQVWSSQQLTQFAIHHLLHQKFGYSQGLELKLVQSNTLIKDSNENLKKIFMKNTVINQKPKILSTSTLFYGIFQMGLAFWGTHWISIRNTAEETVLRQFGKLNAKTFFK